MEIFILVILGLLLALNVFLVWVIISRNKNGSGDSLLLQNQVNELTRSLDSRMGETSKLVQDSMQSQFQESAKIIQDITEKLTRLDETGKQVVSFAEQLQSLQDILRNPKQRGILGEYYLETVLKNVFPPERFQMQYTFSDGEICDAVIYLDKKKILPIDSKFSLENYNRIVETRDLAEKEKLEKIFKSDLKKRIDETAKYIRPNEDTMDFAFMFIPSEGIYYDLLINQIGSIKTSTRGLIEYAFQEKKVIIVSPTSFMAYLQTVLQGLRSLQIEESAKDIRKRVGELMRHLKVYEIQHTKLGNSLGTTINHYNASRKELGKIDKDILRINGERSGIEPLVIESPEKDE